MSLTFNILFFVFWIGCTPSDDLLISDKSDQDFTGKNIENENKNEHFFSLQMDEDTTQTIDINKLFTLKNINDYRLITDSHGRFHQISGTTELVSSFIVTYTPFANFIGDDLVIFNLHSLTANDDLQLHLKINIVNRNDAPLVKNLDITVYKNISKIIAVTAEANDIENDQLTLDVITKIPSNGIAVIKGNDIIYTPDNNFVGKDSLEYSLRDVHGIQTTANLNIKVDNIWMPDTHAIGERIVPVRVAFIHQQQDQYLSTSPQDDAKYIVQKLNEKFIYNNTQLLSFVLKSYENVYAPECYFDDCITTTGTLGSDQYALNLYFNKNVTGSKVGTAYLGLSSTLGGRMFVEYEYLKRKDSKIVIHEVGHIFNLHHTTTVSDKSEIANYKCHSDEGVSRTFYYQVTSNDYTDENNIFWSPGHNMMKWIISDDTTTFFTSGYQDVFPELIQCFYDQNRIQLNTLL